MPDQQLLLLQILKVPVIVIKYLAKALSILTYLPNYLLLFVVDHLLFQPYYQASLSIYCELWLPKLLLLVLGLCLFCLQFYGLFAILQLEQHGWAIQTVGMLMTLAGLLILMRKGYISLIEKYNLSKLKSVKQHIIRAYDFFIDLVGIVLAVVNILLVVNSLKTLDYVYNPKMQYNFLQHIFNTIKLSFIFYIQFFYVKIFFKVFPWRFRKQEQTYLKEKEANNILNCLVLLTLVFLSTLLDLLAFMMFGLPNVIHFKRKIYINFLSTTHVKWKPTLRHFVFIVLHTVQLCLEVIMFPICPKEVASGVKKLWSYSKLSQLFREQFLNLVETFLLRVPYLICNSLIFVGVYKYKRRNLLVKQFQENKDKLSQKQYEAKTKTIVEFSTFKCFKQQCADIFFLPLIALATILQPWKINWLKYLLRKQYQLKRAEIMIILFRGVIQWVALPFCLFFSLMIAVYRGNFPLKMFKKARQEVEEDYKKRVARKQVQSQIDSLFPYTDKDILLVEYLSLCFFTLKQDIPHLPLYFLSITTFLSIYDSNIIPKTSTKIIFNLLRQYFRRSLLESEKGNYYREMHDRMMASGNIYGPSQQFKFWRFAHKCQKLILFQKIFSAFLTKKQISRIKQQVTKGNTLTQISNQFWYEYELLKAYIIRLIYLVIQIILTVIGFTIFLPLTLWRFPTFVKIYIYHKRRKLFFKILFRMYGQMYEDLKYLPVKLFALLISPKMLISFCYKTTFHYGPAGLESFSLYQKAKKKYLVEQIIEGHILPFILNFELIFIYLTWIRIKNLRTFLRRQKLTTFKVYKFFILTSPSVPTIQQMLDYDNYDKDFQDKLRKLLNEVNEIFKEALKDLPYLFVIAILFVAMPWRINYIVQAIKDTRDDSGERKAFIKLLRNIFKDYLCIFMNLVLLFSGFKTRKALLLIRRNYRLNFFIGFLEYSYFNELLKELKNLGLIYIDIVYGLIALLFGWTRADRLINELIDHRKNLKQEQESANANMKIYQNTVKSGKQLQLLNKMGFYNYLSVCSYLSVPDIIALRKVDKLNYQMSKREEVWFTKWQTLYASKHNFIDDQFQARCHKAFILENSNQPRQIVSYHTIILRHFIQNVSRDNVDLAAFAQQLLPTHIYEKIFRYYRYRLDQGYGPENQLPQADDQDQQFLRLTNQMRRPKVTLQENDAWMNWLAFKPVEVVIQAMTRFFRVNQNRRKKQLLIFLIAVSTFSTLLYTIFKLIVAVLWLEDSFIGVRIAIIIYVWCLAFVFAQRYMHLYPTWISLIPFDLKEDVIRFVTYICKQIIKKKMIDPTSNFIKKVGRLIASVFKKVAKKLSDWGQKCTNFAIKTSKTFYYRILKPLYIKIADNIRRFVNYVTFVFQKIFTALKVVFEFLYKSISALFHSIYNFIYAIFSNINKLYYTILKVTMQLFLRFGLLGDLIFTIWGLFLMTMPTWIWWFLYQVRWYLIVSSIHSMVLIVVGYKHLQRIRRKQQ